jgi:hypothetical protein
VLAARRGRVLDAEGVVVLPVGGAHAITRYLTMFGPRGAGLRLEAADLDRLPHPLLAVIADI